MAWKRMALSCAFSGVWIARPLAAQRSAPLCHSRAVSGKPSATQKHGTSGEEEGRGNATDISDLDVESLVAKKVNRQMARRKIMHTTGELKQFMGGQDLVALNEVTGAVISYARENKLLDSRKGKPMKVFLDQTLTKLMHPSTESEISMLKIPSLIKQTDFVQTPESVGDDVAARAASMEAELRSKLEEEASQLFSMRAKREKRKERGRRRMTEEEKEQARNSGVGIWRRMTMSPELISVVGNGENGQMSRPEVVKAIWTYIRENNLQVSPAPNAASGVVISCDRNLRMICGNQSSIGAFAMMKWLSRHLS